MSDGEQPEQRRPHDAPQPDPDADGTDLLARRFTAETVTELRHLLAVQVAAAGLTGDPADDFVLAVHELVSNAVRHGGGVGRLRLSQRDDALRCVVTDHGAGHDSLTVGPPATDAPGGRGLWLARQLTGALTLHRRPDGVTATVTARLTAHLEPVTAPRRSQVPPTPLPGNPDERWPPGRKHDTTG